MKASAPRLGARVEEQIAEQRGYILDRNSWRDATVDGTPVEIKAAIRERESGEQGRFRIFKQPHTKLASQRGVYHFAVYRGRGTGVEILQDKTMKARTLRNIDWVEANHGTDGRDKQRRIPISEVFG